MQYTEVGTFLNTIIMAIPDVIFFLGILLAGWLLALLAKIVVSKILSWLRFNVLCDKLGVAEFLKKGQVKYTPSMLAGLFAYWIMIIFVLLLVADVFGVSVINDLKARTMNLLPGLVTAVIIIAIGSIVSVFISNFVHTIASNAAFPHPLLLAKAVKYTGIVLVLTISFESLNIGSKIIGSTFEIVLAAIAFGTALAFGLGAKDVAKSSVEKFIRNLEEKSRSGVKGGDMEG